MQILLLEDYPPLQHILVLTLQRAGFQVVVAPSVQAVQQARQEHIGEALLVDADDVPLADWAALQALALAHPALPVVALVSPEHADRYAFAPPGVQRLLYKPVRRATLLRALTWALRNGDRATQEPLPTPHGISCPSLCSQNEI